MQHKSMPFPSLSRLRRARRRNYSLCILLRPNIVFPKGRIYWCCILFYRQLLLSIPLPHPHPPQNNVILDQWITRLFLNLLLYMVEQEFNCQTPLQTIPSWSVFIWSLSQECFVLFAKIRYPLLQCDALDATESLPWVAWTSLTIRLSDSQWP